jgi:hypothetical protein
MLLVMEERHSFWRRERMLSGLLKTTGPSRQTIEVLHASFPYWRRLNLVFSPTTIFIIVRSI